MTSLVASLTLSPDKGNNFHRNSNIAMPDFMRKRTIKIQPKFP